MSCSTKGKVVGCKFSFGDDFDDSLNRLCCFSPSSTEGQATEIKNIYLQSSLKTLLRYNL